MKKKQKHKLKKGIYIVLLIVFTAVSVLPAAGTFTNHTDSNIPMDEENITEMFGEGASYNPETGEITYPEKEQKDEEASSKH